MIKRAVAGLLLGAASSAYAVGLYTAPQVGVNAYTYSNSVAVDGSGNAYVSGQVQMDDNSYREVYWKWDNASKSFNAPYVLPTNAGLTASSNGYGIGILPSGNLVMGGRQGTGAASWTNTPGAPDNGWLTHMLETAGQATYLGEQHTIKVKADGTGFYALAKNSTSTETGSWFVNTSTWAQTYTKFAGLTAGSTSARDISPYGVATGSTKSPINGENLAGVNRGFVREADGTTKLLPLDVMATQDYGYAINDAGTLITGMMNYTGDNLFYGAYWTKSGSTWTAHYLGNLPDKTSTGVALATNEAGTLFGGWESNGSNQAVIWDTAQLDEYGQPAAIRFDNYLASYGITSLQGFTRFDKIYDISTVNGVTYISGTGIKSINGVNTSQGFLAVVPEPTTALFVALGGLAMLRRRSH